MSYPPDFLLDHDLADETGHDFRFSVDSVDTGKESILEEAARLTSVDRQSTYGPPAEDFAKTVGMWNALFARKLSEPFTVQDFCLAMMAVKMSRLEKTPDHRDSLVDIAGYANCYWETVEG